MIWYIATLVVILVATAAVGLIVRDLRRHPPQDVLVLRDRHGDVLGVYAIRSREAQRGLDGETYRPRRLA
jgi:hypothetical protein